MTPTGDNAEPGELLRAGPGWYESSWELQNGLEVREAFVDAHAPGGWEPDPPSAT
jgi:hypothetical protein